MNIRLTHGAVGTVTGSCALLETPRGRRLVDCGLFQGTKTLKERPERRRRPRRARRSWCAGPE
jgi:Cft2 family RNA processing exonuclease